MFHFKRVLWAFRKIQLPINRKAIVLDVGSGGNPHLRSDILLDRIAGAEHRSGVPMLIDRLAVIGDATKLPFKDKSIDYVLASHVLEHMENPEAFLLELQRVGKAGYIETPNFICERLNPLQAHCLEVSLVNDTLQIHKKAKPVIDSFMESMHFLTENDRWKDLYFKDPDMFHVRYFWKDRINFKISNPETSCQWVEEIYKKSETNKISTGAGEQRTGWRRIANFLVNGVQKLLRTQRLKNFDIYSVLACPHCKGELLKSGMQLICKSCNKTYSTEPYLNFENT